MTATATPKQTFGDALHQIVADTVAAPAPESSAKAERGPAAHPDQIDHPTARHISTIDSVVATIESRRKRSDPAV